MKRTFLIIFLGCLANAGFAHTSPPVELQALLGAISSLEANFQQTVKSEEGKILQRLSGKVWLKKPAQFRWEVVGKDSRLVVADGKKVWDFDKDLDQVTVQKIDQGRSKAPIFFLTGEVHSLEKDFKIKALPLVKDNCLGTCNVCFELKPKRQEGSFQWIRIGFKNKILTQMELLDQLGQYSVFVFQSVKMNGSIPVTRFQFTPPKGVDVLIND